MQGYCCVCFDSIDNAHRYCCVSVDSIDNAPGYRSVCVDSTLFLLIV